MGVLWNTKLFTVQVCWHWVYLLIPKWALRTQTNSASAALPEARSKPAASSEWQWCLQVRSLGFGICLIKTSHPRKVCQVHFCMLDWNLTALGKGSFLSANLRFPVSSWELEPEGNSLSARRMEHLQELLLHTSALHLKKDHAISFTEVHINFFGLVCCKAIFWQDWESLIYCCNIKCCWALAKAVFFQEFARHWFLEIIIYPLKSKV